MTWHYVERWEPTIRRPDNPPRQPRRLPRLSVLRSIQTREADGTSLVENKLDSTLTRPTFLPRLWNSNVPRDIHAADRRQGRKAPPPLHLSRAVRPPLPVLSKPQFVG